jgi:hypothetical protein
MAKAYFMVRATLTDPSLRDRFDRWYRDEHLPDAARAFGAERAWRGWSQSDPPVHLAVYCFPDLATARHATRAEVIAPLVAEFDRCFPTGTTRTREYLKVAGEWQP